MANLRCPISPSHVVIAFNATKDRTEDELKITIEGVKMAGGILHGGGTLVLLGVFHKIKNRSK